MWLLLLLGIFIVVVFGKAGADLVKGLLSLVVGIILLMLAAAIL